MLYGLDNRLNWLGLNDLLGLVNRYLSRRLNRGWLDRLNGSDRLGGSRGWLVTLWDREVRNGRDLVGQLRHYRADACDVGIVRPFLRDPRNDVQGDPLPDQCLGIESGGRGAPEP